MQKKTFTVNGMSCGHCKATVEQRLNNLDGVASATVSLAEKAVTVEFDEAVVKADDMKEAVNSAGYEFIG